VTFSNTPQRDRVLNDMYRERQGNSLDILLADFGDQWPPRGLNITRQPTHPVTFETYYMPLTTEMAHVHNQEKEFRIHINGLAHISAFFNPASKARADTITHENIHILQKNLLQQGICDIFGRFRRHNVRAMMKPKPSSHTLYLSADDEIQVVLHEMISRHYREHGEIPLNKYELWSFLHHEGVQMHGSCITSLYENEQGRNALNKFFKLPSDLSWFKTETVRKLNTVLYGIRDDQKQEFCRTTLPALYGTACSSFTVTLKVPAAWDTNITLR